MEASSPAFVIDDSPLYRDICARGGVLISSPSFKLSIPHETADGFACLLILDQLRATAPYSGVPSGERRGDTGQATYVHAWQKHESQSRGSQTYTQRIIGSVLETSLSSRFQTVAIPVALDDLASLSSKDLWGNSFVINTYSVPELRALAQESKALWNLQLQQRAERTLKILRRRPSVSPLKNTILFSSMGELSRLVWSPKICPSSMVMTMTPITNDCANVLIWSNNGVQGISLCCQNDELLDSLWPYLLNSWRAANG